MKSPRTLRTSISNKRVINAQIAPDPAVGHAKISARAEDVREIRTTQSGNLASCIRRGNQRVAQAGPTTPEADANRSLSDVEATAVQLPVGMDFVTLPQCATGGQQGDYRYRGR
jgi:hypothetical protein